MTKTSILSSFILLALANSACATVSLTFSNTGTSAIADGYSNSSGTPTTGMTFGLVVDTDGDGFSAGSWNAFDALSSGFLTVGGIATDDYYVIGTSDYNGGGFLTEDGSSFGGDAGSIVDMLGINVLAESLATKSYGILWLETDTSASSYYGFLDSTLLMPSDGVTGDVSATLSELTPGSASHQIQAVPEPATYAAIAGLLALGAVMVRRRRS
jgi:hypothetical protein